MRRLGWLGGMAVLGVLVAGVAWAAQGIQEGQWSFTMTVQGGGEDGETAQAMRELAEMSAEDRAIMEQFMGSMGVGVQGGGAGITTTVSQCITSANPVPKRPDQGKCQDTHSVKGNTVQFTSVCPKSTSSGQITYQNQSMSGRILSTQIERGVETQTTVDISGQYQGPCT